MKLTKDEVETIRIHMNAFKERLCNQRRWNEAQEYQDIIDKLDGLLTAEPIRHGYWIRKEWAEESEGLLIDNYECSECKSWERKETNYCPNCGARMDAERKEE